MEIVSSPGPRPSGEAAAIAEWLEGNGQQEAAERVRVLADHLIEWEAQVIRQAGEALAVHHDIRNALTGVLGNAQLVLMGPGADVPGVKRRLESLVHEAERIKDITDRLHKARAELLAPGDGAPPADGRASSEGGPSTDGRPSTDGDGEQAA